MSADVVVKILVWVGRVFKWMKLEKLVRAVRLRVSKTLFQRLHSDVIHNMRDFVLSVNEWTPETKSNDVCYAARNTVTACRNLMSDILEIPDQELHCCMKAFAKDENYRDRVITWARSTPQDGHKDDKQLDGNHRIVNNSVYSSLMARNDGKTDWTRAFTCFSCNDLTSAGPNFVCSRNNWEKHYNSTIVFPLRYIVNSAEKEFYTVGFLCFYSMRKDAFVGMPNIFNYIQDYDGYAGKLEDNCIFHMGASMADMLSTFLRMTYKEDKLSKRDTNENARRMA